MMDPFQERRLRDEVAYLHSLWRQGPPPNPNHPRHPPPVSDPTPSSKRKKPPFSKKTELKKPKDGARNKLPEKEWPCKEPVPGSPPAWPAMKKHDPGRAIPPASTEELAMAACRRMQQRVLRMCHEFFGKATDSDGNGTEEEDEEEEEEEDEEGDEWDVDDGALKGSEEYKFFLGVFVRDGELRDYYERNHESGEFCCFVCGVLGGKMSGRKFKNCLALLQHSVSISHTKKRRAHRAFALVLCTVMGWDFERLPLIFAKGEPLSRSLAGPGSLPVMDNG